ncbi:MAG: YcbK family protein [Myxococcota bacterium]
MRARRAFAVFGLALAALAPLSAVALARKEPPKARSTGLIRATAKPRAARVERREPAPVASPFAALPSVRLANLNTREALDLKLYDAEGRVDPESARKLDALLVDARDPDNIAQTELDRRTLQLLFRAAYHFKASNVEVVSAYRKPGRRREGLHAQGRAIDFKLPGVPAATLASYLRTLPRVGVGVYTHPRTQYVHLDVREQSFHWLDASPPGRRWRERSLKDPRLAARDASYHESMDLPESCVRSVAR